MKSSIFDLVFEMEIWQVQSPLWLICMCSLLHSQMTFLVDLQPTIADHLLIAVKLVHCSYDTCDRRGNRVIVLGYQVCLVDMMILIARHTEVT
jgi:hypothetical protein